MSEMCTGNLPETHNWRRMKRKLQLLAFNTLLFLLEASELSRTKTVCCFKTWNIETKCIEISFISFTAFKYTKPSNFKRQVVKQTDYVVIVKQTKTNIIEDCCLFSNVMGFPNFNLHSMIYIVFWIDLMVLVRSNSSVDYRSKDFPSIYYEKNSHPQLYFQIFMLKLSLVVSTFCSWM